MYSISREKLINLQPNVDPFLFIGEIVELKIGESVRAKWELDPNYWFFKCHWPKNPNVPGVIQIEAVLQTSSLMFFADKKNTSEYIYITKINYARFFKKVVPNDLLEIRCSTLKNSRGVATVKGEITRSHESILKINFDFALSSNQEYVPILNGDIQ
jgi:3-hydroxymyristoyl/3-hydroxydecanoyl-(acyl carrier protein) dehydratase